jgi:hypothetical protein
VVIYVEVDRPAPGGRCRSACVSLPTASEDPPEALGGLDLMSYCQANGWDTVIFPRGQLAPDAAVDNWRCASGDRSVPISMEQACKWQYGINDVQARFTDLNDAFTWVCYAVGNG